MLGFHQAFLALLRQGFQSDDVRFDGRELLAEASNVLVDSDVDVCFWRGQAAIEIFYCLCVLGVLASALKFKIVQCLEPSELKTEWHIHVFFKINLLFFEQTKSQDHHCNCHKVYCKHNTKYSGRSVFCAWLQWIGQAIVVDVYFCIVTLGWLHVYWYALCRVNSGQLIRAQRTDQLV